MARRDLTYFVNRTARIGCMGPIAIMVISVCLLACHRPAERAREQRHERAGESAVARVRPEIDQIAGEGEAPLPEMTRPISAPATVTTTNERRWQESTRRTMDPAQDGWDTEAFAERANEQLHRLQDLLANHHAPLPTRDLIPLVAESFVCSPLRPTELRDVLVDSTVTVRRPKPDPTSTSYAGVDGLKDALERLVEGLENATAKYAKFKLFHVQRADAGIDTTCYFEISGRVDGGSLQRSATWNCRWTEEQNSGLPRLSSIELTDYEEVHVRRPQQTLFSDVTRQLFGETGLFEQQFMHGIDYWRSHLENYLGIYFDGLHGLAIGDVNGDHLDDLYLCEPGGLPNRLLIQSADGRLHDISVAAGLDFLNPTRSALFVDLDNDGDQDLVTAMDRQIHLLANDGGGRFRPMAATPSAGQTAYSLAAADYDADGDIDIYACNYHGVGEAESNRLPAPIPLHDARTGGPNQLWRNDGDWKFHHVTNECGLDHNNDRWSYAAAWEDYDNDGDLDLYVVNDFGRNNLYRNEGGRFTDVAGPAGAEDMNFGMSASFGDFDRDGWMDIYISNMFSAAGGRITSQPNFQTDGSGEVRAAYQRMVRGNTLLQNVGNGTFRDVSDAARVSMGRWAWGSFFGDINNDGWEDLAIANGFVTGHLPGDL